MSRLRFELVPEGESSGEPVSVYCKTCGDIGTVPGDPIFVNTEHNYGIEYRRDDPCPNCSLDDEDLS